MSEESTSESKPSTSGSSTSSQSSMGVPVAIVVAGALIAVALYFGGGGNGGGNVAGVGTGDTVDLGEVAAEPVAPAGPTIGEVRPVTDVDHVRGAANAKVTIIEYSDLECPFCKRFHSTMMQVVDEYPDDVRWVYRHFPLEQLHQQAIPEAIATECAGEQGKFWELTDLIYEVTPGNDGLDLKELPIMAAEAGVSNLAQFETCLDSGKYDDRIKEDLADATAAGGRGTPYSVIMGPDGEMQPLSGAQPYASVKAAVDSLL